MNSILRLCLGILLMIPNLSTAQCTTTNAKTCSCKDGTNNCDLLPDIGIARPPLLVSGSSGVIEYSQTGNGANNGRLRISVSTPNTGFGPLEIRAQAIYVCGTDTFYGSAPTSCTDGSAPKQLIKQRVYHKTDSVMSYYDRDAGTMTYHPTHGHMHVDNWGVFTLRTATTDPNPLNWPIVGNGAKLAFCLMDYGSCSTYNGHCVDSAGATLTNGNFPNFGLGGGSYSCSPTFQGISSGWTDIYYQSLDGMWIDIPPGVCNGQYYIVAQIDPLNYFLESKENNNIMVVPWTLTQQSGTPTVSVSGPTTICPGQSVTLTCSAAASYLWSNGETTQAVTITTPGSYTVTATNTSCVFTSTPITVTVNSLNVSSGVTPASLCAGTPTQLSASVSNIPQQGPVGFTTNVPVNIIDYSSTTGATPVYSPLVVSGITPSTLVSGAIVSVKINLTHTYNGDIEVWVKAPSGDSTLLSNRRGGSGDNFTNTIFSMSAATNISAGVAPFTGTYKPDGNLNTALTGTINGTWKLIVVDRAAVDVGQILNWTLTVLNNETFSYAWISNLAGFISSSQNPAVTPSTSTQYTVTVTSSATGCTGSSSISTSVTPAISVAAMSPISGGPGTLVLLTGSGFTGATSVTFNGVAAASYTVNNDNQIAAVVFAVATSGLICISNGSCSGCTVGNFTVVSTSALNLKLFIEGFYNGPNSMVAVSDPSNHPSICDTIQVELIENIVGYPVVYSGVAILATNGMTSVQIPLGLSGKNCFVCIQHRNALQTWSNTAMNLTGGTLTYDFTTALNQAYGSNQKSVGGGVFALYSGDVNQDEFLESSDYSMIENQAQSFTTGYVSEDLNGDWIVESSDYSLIENTSQSFIYVLRP